MKTTIAMLLGLTALLTGCTDSSAANKALTTAGYTHVRITGWDMWGCAHDDGTCTSFEAVGPTGVVVQGAVGCGYFFKGCTIRLK